MLFRSNDTATTEIYTLSLHDALPICREQPTLVVFGEPDSSVLLGAFTLEGLRLGVDSVNKQLIPTPAYLVGLRLDDNRE